MEFEVPFRELGFHGVPHRSTAFVMPTVNCLVRSWQHPSDHAIASSRLSAWLLVVGEMSTLLSRSQSYLRTLSCLLLALTSAVSLHDHRLS